MLQGLFLFISRCIYKVCECIYNLIAHSYDYIKDICGNSNPPPVYPDAIIPNPRVNAQIPPVAPNRRIDNANSFNIELSNLDNMSEQKECTICLTPFAEGGYGEITTLPCLHVFHKECVDPWLAQNGNCPVCRDDTIPNTPSNDVQMSLFPSQI